MANERYPQDDYYNRTDPQDYGRDYGSGRAYSYGSARDYQAAGGDRDRQGGHGGSSYGRDDDAYGRRDYGNQRYGQREQGDRGYGREGYGRAGSSYGAGGYSQSNYDRGSYGQDGDRGYSSQRDSGYYQDRSQSGRTGYRQGSYGRDQGSSGEYHGSYASDGRRFEDVGRYRDADDDNRGRQGQSWGRNQNRGQSYGRQPQGYNYEERGFLDRAGDEVRSWFGDEEAERRREADARYDERQSGERYGSASYGSGSYGSDRDSDYRSWRRTQMDALDRDYDEYRQHNRSKFENEFSSWRTGRQGQRDLLNKIEEHQDVVGSDGEHVGTVDKVRGDRVILTKSDKDAGGHHHSFPSSWLQSVDGKVTLSKTAAEAKSAWKDEERKGAMFGDNQSSGSSTSTGQSWGGQSSASSTSTSGSTGTGTSDDTKSTDLNRSFSGTY